jgi:divinyl protochlorophyllide a 8-vinyl-reductase
MLASPAGRIGPNAITQMAAALDSELGTGAAEVLLRAVGLGAYLRSPPQSMVDEQEVIVLHEAVRERLPRATAGCVTRDAGRRTADYLLAHRIPAVVQRLLRPLPAAVSSRVLLRAIARHAWTFAGSGRCTVRAGRPVLITIVDCPLCRGAVSHGPMCAYYAATFERLFSQLVHPRARVLETACAASGAAACRFEIDWRRARR